MKFISVGILLILTACSKNNHNSQLFARITEIKALESYNNTVVAYPDSFRIRLYSYHEKYPYNPYHPYLYLRDTATIEDLEKLVTSEHPFVKTYAFAALNHRNYNGLFQIVLKNLKDTTRMQVFTDDVGYQTTSPDMMLQYVAEKFSAIQKDTIARLILTKYNHLNTINEVLLFHKPIQNDYSLIKSIVLKGGDRSQFGVVALSRYQKEEDVELISLGFANPDYYSGYKFFFKAIEEFPHGSFKQRLLDYRREIKKGFDFSGLDYYFNALAKYHDSSCTNIIEEFVEQYKFESEGYKDNCFASIYKALKKYDSPDYEPLINKIEHDVSDKWILTFDDNYLEQSPWNY